MIVCEATGWCGVAATLFAPPLKNKYYLAFCVFLIVSGLVHAFYTVKRLNNPRIFGFLKIRALLRELRGSSRRATTNTLISLKGETPAGVVLPRGTASNLL